MRRSLNGNGAKEEGEGQSAAVVLARDKKRETRQDSQSSQTITFACLSQSPPTIVGRVKSNEFVLLFCE